MHRIAHVHSYKRRSATHELIRDSWSPSEFSGPSRSSRKSCAVCSKRRAGRRPASTNSRGDSSSPRKADPEAFAEDSRPADGEEPAVGENRLGARIFGREEDLHAQRRAEPVRAARHRRGLRQSGASGDRRWACDPFHGRIRRRSAPGPNSTFRTISRSARRLRSVISMKRPLRPAGADAEGAGGDRFSGDWGIPATLYCGPVFRRSAMPCREPLTLTDLARTHASAENNKAHLARGGLSLTPPERSEFEGESFSTASQPPKT